MSNNNILINNITLIHSKCEKILPTLSGIDVVVTSPPYNIGKEYSTYKDSLKYEKYLEWIYEWTGLIKKSLKNNGSFFLNIGSKPSNPYIVFDVLNECRKHFVLQNTIHWVKSIYLENFSYGREENINVGHFKPINSDRFVNDLHEFVFHFTKKGNVKIDRLSLGVPYKDSSNIKRWSKKLNKRCRGNIWYIPYKTACSKKIHPAQFPPLLAKNCIKLHGYDKNTLVVDPFVGVGNTCVACIDLGCKCIGIDLDKYYLDEAQKAVNNAVNKNLQIQIFI